MVIDITKAETGDTDAVFKIFTEARERMDYIPRLHSKHETFYFIKALIEKGGLFVAKKMDEPIGIIYIDNGWVHHLYVASQWQNKRVGKELLDFAKRKYPNGLSLWVFEANKSAISFYEREEFLLIEKRDMQHSKNEEHLPDRMYRYDKKQ